MFIFICIYLYRWFYSVHIFVSFFMIIRIEWFLTKSFCIKILRNKYLTFLPSSCCYSGIILCRNILILLINLFMIKHRFQLLDLLVYSVKGKHKYTFIFQYVACAWRRLFFILILWYNVFYFESPQDVTLVFSKQHRCSCGLHYRTIPQGSTVLVDSVWTFWLR